MTVWLCQVKCEQGHCMVAGGFDDATTTVEQGTVETREGWLKMVAAGVTPRCRICGGEKFHTETGRTRWTTLEDAMPFLRLSEAANMRTGDLWEDAAAVTKEILERVKPC